MVFASRGMTHLTDDMHLLLASYEATPRQVFVKARIPNTLPFAFTAMPDDADKGLTLLVKAIELEPDYAAAHAMIAWCHEQRYLRGGLHQETRDAALDHARTAIAVGGDDAAALATAAFVIA